MALTILRDVDADLVRVQQNVAGEIAKLEAAVPAKNALNTSITDDYSIKLTDAIVLALPPSSLNVTLPDARACFGQSFTVKNCSTAGTVVIRGSYVNGLFQQVDQQGKITLAGLTAARCYSDGKRWWVL